MSARNPPFKAARPTFTKALDDAATVNTATNAHPSLRDAVPGAAAGAYGAARLLVGAERQLAGCRRRAGPI